jgi:protein SCO1/2
MMRSARRLASSFVACSALLAWSCAPQNFPAERAEEHFFRGQLVWDTPLASNFTLTDQDEQPFRLSDQRGHVVLMFFGFVQCPDVCPATLSMWSKMAKKLGEDRDQVRFLYITVDPERDTPASLGRYVRIFGPDFIGLTGPVEDLQAVYKAYEIKQNKLLLFGSSKGYVMEHTSHTFLVDPEGVLRLKYQYNTRSDDLFTDVRWLLDHREAAGEPPLRVEDVWSRPTAAPGAAAEAPLADVPPGVIYLTIENRGTRDDRLVAVRTEVSEAAELHETTHDVDYSRMGPVEGGVPIPAGETVPFAPGGLHLMLIGLRRHLVTGDRFEATLLFESGAEIPIESEVRSP